RPGRGGRAPPDRARHAAHLRAGRRGRRPLPLRTGGLSPNCVWMRLPAARPQGGGCRDLKSLRLIPERFLFVLSKRNPSDSKGGQRPLAIALRAPLLEAFR